MGLWLRDEGGAIVIRVHVSPRSSKNALGALHGDALGIKITQAPVDGKANEGVVSYLAACFGVKKRDVEIASGETSRQKMVRIRGISAEKALSILNLAP